MVELVENKIGGSSIDLFFHLSIRVFGWKLFFVCFSFFFFLVLQFSMYLALPSRCLGFCMVLYVVFFLVLQFSMYLALPSLCLGPPGFGWKLFFVCIFFSPPIFQVSGLAIPVSWILYGFVCWHFFFNPSIFRVI